MNKKGIVNQVIIVIIIFVALVTLIIAVWGFGTLAPLVIGQSQTLASTVGQSLQDLSPDSAIQNASEIPIETAQSILGVAEGIYYLLFIGAFLGFFAVAYYVRTYKWLSILWFGLVIGAVLISAVASNAYQTTYESNSNVADIYSTWGTNDFLLRYLPVIVGVSGTIAGIILFAISTTGTEEETTEQL